MHRVSLLGPLRVLGIRLSYLLCFMFSHASYPEWGVTARVRALSASFKATACANRSGGSLEPLEIEFPMLAKMK